MKRSRKTYRQIITGIYSIHSVEHSDMVRSCTQDCAGVVDRFYWRWLWVLLLLLVFHKTPSIIFVRIGKVFHSVNKHIKCIIIWPVIFLSFVFLLQDMRISNIPCPDIFKASRLCFVNAGLPDLIEFHTFLVDYLRYSNLTWLLCARLRTNCSFLSTPLQGHRLSLTKINK